MKKRIFALSLALALIFSLAACGNSAAPAADTPAAAPAAPGDAAPADAAPAGDAEKPEEIFMVYDVGMTEENGSQIAWDYYTEKTGIKLRMSKPPHEEYYEKVALFFASNDIPDVLEVSGVDYTSYASQGALYDITDLVAASPRLSQTPQSMLDQVTIDGRIYGVQKEVGNGNMTYVRKDWLDALGMEVPTTFDEFTDMLRRFKAEDASGTGNTVGYIVAGFNGEGYLSDWLQDARYDFYNKDGTWVDGFAEDAMAAALQRMATAYQEGLMDPDVFTLSTADARTKFYTGNIGCFTYWAGGWNATINREIQKNIPTASVVPIPAFDNVKFVNRVAPTFAVTNGGAAGNPEGVFKHFIEYIFDGGEGQTWATHGVEGHTYVYEGDKMVALPSLSEPDATPTKPVKTFIEAGLNYLPFDDPFELMPEVVSSQAIFMEDMRAAELVTPVETFVRNQAGIGVLREETIAMAMKGDMTVEAAMERYKSEMASAYESDAILAELNAQ